MKHWKDEILTILISLLIIASLDFGHKTYLKHTQYTVITQGEYYLLNVPTGLVEVKETYRKKDDKLLKREFIREIKK